MPEQEPKPRLSVVVITWNERNELIRCLEALDAHPASGGQEVIVVDNASSDGTPDIVRERFKQVTLVENDRNLGVTTARNEGLRIAEGRYVAMLDSDAYVQAHALETLCRFLDENRDVGLVGPKLVYEDGEVQMSCRRVPSLLALVANRLPSVGWLREHPERRRYLMLDEAHDRKMDVEYVLGATMVFRRDAATRIGSFDERFGFSMPGGYGFDDADWALRFRAAGWRVVYVPDAVVIHGYRRRLVKRPFSRESLALAASYVLLRLKHGRLARMMSSRLDDAGGALRQALSAA